MIKNNNPTDVINTRHRIFRGVKSCLEALLELAILSQSSICVKCGKLAVLRRVLTKW